MNALLLALWDLSRLLLVAGCIVWASTPIWEPWITKVLGDDR